MKKIKVTMIRSKIREKNTTKRVLQSLGLKKIGQTRIFNYNDSVMGMVKKITHLLSYEIFDEKKTEAKGSKLEVGKEKATKTKVKKTEKKESADKTTPKAKKTVAKNETLEKPAKVKKETSKSEGKEKPKTKEVEAKKEVKKTVEKETSQKKVTDKADNNKPKGENEKVDGGKDEA